MRGARPIRVQSGLQSMYARPLAGLAVPTFGRRKEGTMTDDANETLARRCRRAAAKAYGALKWVRVEFSERNLRELGRKGFPAISVAESRRLYLYRGESGAALLALDLREPGKDQMYVPVFAQAASGERLRLVECSRRNDARRVFTLVPGDAVILRMTAEQAARTSEAYYRAMDSGMRADHVACFGSVEAAKHACQVDLLRDNYGFPNEVTAEMVPFLESQGAIFEPSEAVLKDVRRAVRLVFRDGTWPTDVDPGFILREDDEDDDADSDDDVDEASLLDAWRMPTRRILLEDERNEALAARESKRAALNELLADMGDEGKGPPTPGELERLEATAKQAAKKFLDNLGLSGKADVMVMYTETLSRAEVDAICESATEAKHPPVHVLRVSRDGKLLSDEAWEARRRDSAQRIVETAEVSLLPAVEATVHIRAEWVGVKMLDDRRRALSRHMFAISTWMRFSPEVEAADRTDAKTPALMSWCETEDEARALVARHADTARHDESARKALIAGARTIIMAADPKTTQADIDKMADEAQRMARAATRDE